MDNVQSAHMHAWKDRLLELGLAVRLHLATLIASGARGLAEPVAQEGGDTIFAIDRHVEPVIEQAIEDWPADAKPLLLIAEGFGSDGRKIFGNGTSNYRLIIDPIDGTRGLMYDKRPAWFIASVAWDRGEATRLADVFASVLVELPTSKQLWADAFSAVAGGSATCTRAHRDGSAGQHINLCPSGATNLLNGFGHVSSFFPGIKVLAAELLEHLALSTLGPIQPGHATIFDDQYISTAGQMVELMLGRDRFCCDIRPLLFQAKNQGTTEAAVGLACHPYDVAGLLVAQEAGVVITDGFGRPLDLPLDVHTPVHWCGYANDKLYSVIQPLINQWLAERDVFPE